MKIRAGEGQGNPDGGDVFTPVAIILIGVSEGVSQDECRGQP